MVLYSEYQSGHVIYIITIINVDFKLNLIRTPQDGAAGVQDWSRLACQIDITKALEGATFVVPDNFSDAR